MQGFGYRFRTPINTYIDTSHNYYWHVRGLGINSGPNIYQLSSCHNSVTLFIYLRADSTAYCSNTTRAQNNEKKDTLRQ